MSVITAALAAIFSIVAPVPAAPAATGYCNDPVWTTTDLQEQHGFGDYIAAADAWNADGYNYHQTMGVCSYHSFYAVATADDSKGDGAVKSYPNMHVDFHNWSTGNEPRLRDFRKVQSFWAASSPDRGVYNAAYDIWLNGVADQDSNELMIWTKNHGQTPAGDIVARDVKLSKHTWNVWASSDHGYIALVPQSEIPSGRIYIKHMVAWLQEHGILPKPSTIGQIDYGTEIVSTNGTPERFDVTNFGVDAVRK